MTAFEDDAHDARQHYNQTTPAAPGASNGPVAARFASAGFTETDPAIWTRATVIIRCSVPFMGKGEFQVWSTDRAERGIIPVSCDTPREALAVASVLDDLPLIVGGVVGRAADELARSMEWPNQYNPLARAEITKQQRQQLEAGARRLVAEMLDAVLQNGAALAEAGR